MMYVFIMLKSICYSLYSIVTCKFFSPVAYNYFYVLYFYSFVYRKEDLTLRFYGCKALLFIRVRELEKSLKKFFDHTSIHSLVEGAMFISHWGQIEQEKLAKLEEVETTLYAIAQRVIQSFANKHRNLKIVKRNVLGEMVIDTGGNPELEKKVLVSINDILYGEMGFHGNVDDYYNYDNSFIDKV